MSVKLLSDREQRILNILKKKGTSWFNELYRDLATYVSRPTLKKDLENLSKMGLISVKKGRMGQKDVYTSTEILLKFEERIKHLETEWAKLFDRLNEVCRLLETGELQPNEAGYMVASILYTAIHVGSSGITLDRTFSFDAKKRLRIFCLEKLDEFVTRMCEFGESHPEILGGFEKTCSEILESAKRVCEEIENKLEAFA